MAISTGLFDFLKATDIRIGVESIIGYSPARALSTLGVDDFVTKSMLSVRVPSVVISVSQTLYTPFSIPTFSETYPQFAVPGFVLREYFTNDSGNPAVRWKNNDLITYDQTTDTLYVDFGNTATGDLTIYQP